MYAPFLAMVLSPLVETLTVTVFSSSGTKIRLFWRFGARLVFPDGLNCVARVRLLYFPPIWVFLPVMSHCFAISIYKLVATYYHAGRKLQPMGIEKREYGI